jgi:hypothetical protein
MPRIARRAADCLRHPVRTFHSLRLRADIARLELRNRFSHSPVATGKPGAVVSLTTYGKRVSVAHLAIESIARGSVVPSRLILWLDDTALFANPPQPLRRLQQRGLEIRLCKNYGPHKKYYCYVESEQDFTDPLVTADDDVIYPRSWLAGLVDAYQQFPQYVNCYRARVMTLRDGVIASYRDWPLCDSTKPDFKTMATGVSGVIYPGAVLKELKRAGLGFESRCSRNDDLWLHVHAVRSGFRIRQIQPDAIHFPIIPGTHETALYVENYAQGDGNDRQIALVYETRDLELIEGKAVAAHA